MHLREIGLAGALAMELFTCCVIIACERPQRVEVELDAFSGRPNPKWELSRDKAADFLSTIRSLPKTNAAVPEGGLGYRGFVLRSGGRSMRFYRGLLTVQEGASVRVYRDVAKIEAQLADDARERGYGAVVEGVPGSR